MLMRNNTEYDNSFAHDLLTVAMFILYKIISSEKCCSKYYFMEISKK